MKKSINLFLAAILSIGLVGCSGNQIDTSKISINKEVKDVNSDEKLVAPDFELLDLYGKKRVLKDYKGSAVILNFFNTWNPESVKQIPDLIKAGNVYKDKGIEIIYVFSKESMEEVSQFIKDNPIGGINILIDSNGDVTKRYKVESTPTTYIIDKEGYIFARLAKIVTNEELKTIIESLI